jgi:hypothetical protein
MIEIGPYFVTCVQKIGDECPSVQKGYTGLKMVGHEGLEPSTL